MQKEKIIEILQDWNFWNNNIDVGIARPKYLELFKKLEKTSQVIVVTGPRRAGKSTLLKQYIKSLIESGADRASFLYVNIEEPRFIDDLSVQFLQDIYDAYLEIVSPKSKPRIFFDEIQNIPGWEKFVRGIHERGEATVFVSGSSAKLLGKELGTALTGRHADIVVYPLSFQEFLEFKGIILKNKLDTLAKKKEIRHLLREYVQYGGFPLICKTEEKQELLARYFEDILIRDVSVRHNIKKTDKLRSLGKYYLSNTSTLSSFRGISKFLDLSLDSVERYSSYMEDAYLMFLVKKFAYSLKEQEKNARKAYAIDTGLKTVLGFSFSQNLGRLYENLVFLEFKRKGQVVYYHAQKKECDFLVKQGNRIKLAVQVCAEFDKTNRQREIEGLEEAMKNFNAENGLIITDGVEDEIKICAKTVKIVPLWKWLLE